ncbi:MAG: type II secretion system protein [Janthinobacterium lividum]
MRFFSENSARRLHRQRGFGLLESLICVSLMALLFLGAMTMILSATRGTVRTQAQVYSTGDAANAIQNVIGHLRESSGFALPTTDTAGASESGTFPWTMPSGYTQGQFYTTLNGETINTAVEVTAPLTMTPSMNGYTASVPSLRVLSTTGGYWAASTPSSPQANWPVAPYNVQLAGSFSTSTVSIIYRGDANYMPDAAAGTYLWLYSLPSSTVPQSYPVALCKSVSTAPNAIQFVRPVYSGVAEQNQLEVKVISSYYSPINGQQTSEEGTGASSSQLTGKCVFMRDHYTGSISGTTTTQSSNNVFQYH